ncbi:hypothetical protein [Erythrobacter sp.]|nr:hypothetical protein [Erythrobacter sp.]
MSRHFTNTLAALAAVILATSSMAAIVDVPPASEQAPAAAMPLPELA